MLGARPIINGSSAQNDPISETNSGITIQALDPQAIVDAIKQIRLISVDARKAMGERAQVYAIKQFDANSLAQKLNQALG